MSRILPILFNTDMVRAILDGRKTVTRRLIKPQPKMKLCYTFAGEYKKDIGKWTYPSESAYEFWGDEYKRPDSLIEEDLKMKWNPPYHTDDILYVRETWSGGYEDGTYVYKADDKLVDLHEFEKSSKLIYRPSILMPKKAARIWLKVTDVRVERLQEITTEQILKEGCGSYDTTPDGFCYLWDSTIKKSDLNRYGWDANPYVWAIEFERCEKPEPCVMAGMESAEDKRPCIGYGKSDIDDEPCEMCKRCNQHCGYEEEKK